MVIAMLEPIAALLMIATLARIGPLTVIVMPALIAALLTIAMRVRIVAPIRTASATGKFPAAAVPEAAAVELSAVVTGPAEDKRAPVAHGALRVMAVLAAAAEALAAAEVDAGEHR
jgi:hypothetical protein